MISFRALANKYHSAVCLNKDILSICIALTVLLKYWHYTYKGVRKSEYLTFEIC